MDSKQEKPITHRIYEIIFELLDKNPEGISWTELISMIKVAKPNFHPKTINGCVWNLVQKFPNKVYKPSKGMFRLIKYNLIKG